MISVWVVGDSSVMQISGVNIAVIGVLSTGAEFFSR